MNKLLVWDSSDYQTPSFLQQSWLSSFKGNPIFRKVFGQALRSLPFKRQRIRFSDVSSFWTDLVDHLEVQLRINSSICSLDSIWQAKLENGKKKNYLSI